MIPLIVKSIISAVASTQIKGVSQTIGEAVKAKTNIVALPFFGLGVTFLTNNPESGVGLGLVFGSMVMMTIRDTLNRLIKLQQAKNEAS